eukprot:COSAG01_NODE_2199_length_8180_cov_7.460262_4_plen_139_part_00
MGEPPAKKVTVAQITVPTDKSFVISLNVQGRSAPLPGGDLLIPRSPPPPPLPLVFVFWARSAECHLDASLLPVLPPADVRHVHHPIARVYLAGGPKPKDWRQVRPTHTKKHVLRVCSAAVYARHPRAPCAVPARYPSF